MFKKFMMLVVFGTMLGINLMPASACDRCRQKSCRSGEACCRSSTSNAGRRDFVVDDDLLSGLAREIHKHKMRSLTSSRDLGTDAKEDEALSRLERKYKDFLPAGDQQTADRVINAKGTSDRNVALLAGLAFQVLNLVKSKPDIGNTKTQSEILALVAEVAKDIESLKQDQKAKKNPNKKKCNVLTGECDEDDSTDSEVGDSSPATAPSKTKPTPEAQIAQGVNELSAALEKLSKAAEAANKAAEEAKVKRDKESEALRKNLETIKALQKALADPEKPTEGEPETVRSRTSTSRTPIRPKEDADVEEVEVIRK